MPAQIRIATPTILQAPAAAALARLDGARARLVGAEGNGEVEEPRQTAALQRIWLERRAGRGAGVVEAAQALREGSVRAVLLALARQAEAVLVAQAATAAWDLLEPERGLKCSDVWRATGGWEFFWTDWESGDCPSAVAWLGARLGRPVAPLAASFRGGRDPLRGAVERWLATLRARVGCVAVELYSPLLFRDGVLQVAALAAALRRDWERGPLAAAVPLLCIPQLGREEFARRWRAEGGEFSGAIRAGAELPAARIAPEAGPATWQATLDVLCALT